MPFGSLSLEKLRSLLLQHGVRQIYVKPLAENDNSKNQIYFGPGFDALNIFPHGDVKASPDATTLKAPVRFRWLDDSGALHEAPGAQLILYPDYPEVRLSGFLKGCRTRPSALLAGRARGRVLVLGVTTGGEIIGYPAAAADPVAEEWRKWERTRQAGVFTELLTTDERAVLLSELRRIHELGWINGKRLDRNGNCLECTAQNCGGYTLEAELGIRPNGYSEPDFLGYEVKQYGVVSLERPRASSPITLMTPEPNGGYYAERGPAEFLRRFGYPDRKGRENRINFGGIFRHDTVEPNTGLRMVLQGYDCASGIITDPGGGIALVTDTGEPAAVWKYDGLISHWTRKHRRAVYVPSESRKEPVRQYRYGSIVLLGSDTDFFRFLKALAAGAVFYDPGIKLEGAGTPAERPKRRSQFRIKWDDLPRLYAETEVVDVVARQARI